MPRTIDSRLIVPYLAEILLQSMILLKPSQWPLKIFHKTEKYLNISSLKNSPILVLNLRRDIPFYFYFTFAADDELEYSNKYQILFRIWSLMDGP